MILVELTRDMRPRRAGDDALLPDAAALALLASGDARNPRDRFGAPVDPVAVPESASTRVARGRHYRTK